MKNKQKSKYPDWYDELFSNFKFSENTDFTNYPTMMQDNTKANIAVQPVVNTFEYGGPTKKFNKFRETLPDNQRLTPLDKYDMLTYWKLNGKPKDFDEALKREMFSWDDSDNLYHANTLAYDRKGNGRFTKPKDHDTVQYELDYYNNGTITEEGGIQREPTQEEKAEWEYFRNHYDLTDDPKRPNFYMYKRKGRRFDLGGFTGPDDPEELARKLRAAVDASYRTPTTMSSDNTRVSVPVKTIENEKYIQAQKDAAVREKVYNNTVRPVSNQEMSDIEHSHKAEEWMLKPANERLNDATNAALITAGTVALPYSILAAPIPTAASLLAGGLGSVTTDLYTNTLSHGTYNNWGDFVMKKTNGNIPESLAYLTNPGGILTGGFAAKTFSPYNASLFTGLNRLKTRETYNPEVFNQIKNFHLQNKTIYPDRYYEYINIPNTKIIQESNPFTWYTRRPNSLGYHTPGTNTITLSPLAAFLDDNKYNGLIGHEIEHRFQDLMINPLSSRYRNYYAANPNNSLYNDALHLFNKNIKPNGKVKWSASPDELDSEMMNWKLSDNKDVGTKFIDMNDYDKNLYIKRAAKRFNLNKSEANQVLTTLSANGYF